MTPSAKSKKLRVLIVALTLAGTALLGGATPARCQEEPSSEDQPELRITIGARSFIPQSEIKPPRKFKTVPDKLRLIGALW